MRGDRTARLNDKLILSFKKKHPKLSAKHLAEEICKEHPEVGKPSAFRKVVSRWSVLTEGGTIGISAIDTTRKMTTRWVITRNPQAVEEHRSDYIDRIENACKADNIATSKKQIKHILRSYRADWIKTHESQDGNGDVISTKFKVERIEDLDTTQLEIVAATSNPNGKPWLKYKKSALKPPVVDIELIKEALGNINMIKSSEINTKPTDGLLRLIYTDAHIAMETDESGNGMYGGVWNARELHKRKDKMIQEVILAYDGQKEIHIVDLGDLMDGWDGFTTRKGHNLPQNMDNREAHRTALKFKVEIADHIQKRTGALVTCYNIVNDNHSGDFSGVVNDSVQKIMDLTNENIEYEVLEKFMNHYIWNNHCFVLSHGKDSKHMKHGLKPKMDDATLKKIEGYIKHHKLYDYKIAFEKGDSHQLIIDYSSSDLFDYFNYMALSPASEWVQTNFQKGSSGFAIMECWAGKTKRRITPFEFDWKNN